MPTDKEFRTLENQIRLLKERNLTFQDLRFAKKSLIEKNYFNLINGFETLLLDDPKNPPKKYTNKSFDDFIRLYEFDQQFSGLVFNKISEFETKLKTAIAYHFCKNHCSTLAENNGYMNIENYNIPSRTDGPKEFVNNFYTRNYNGKINNKYTHKLFRNNYNYRGTFRGTFTGNVMYLKETTKLEGTFTGRFGSTSIKEVINGNCEFYNSKEKIARNNLRAKTTTTGNVSLSIEMKNEEKISGLNFIDSCKTKFPYINEYKNPPFWVAIKALMLNDVIILLYGLKKHTIDAVLREFDLKPPDKQKFLNSLEIIKALRNSCAHFDLINRFRTPSNMNIDARLISELQLKPKKRQYIIKLFDVLKILNLYVDLSDIKRFLLEYWNQEKKNHGVEIATALLDRMGNSDINEWIKNL